ncbi:MAG: ABC transporter ATP-binding protein [Phycisphaeraceae bacterium]|nr:ABC transporter ATP-binding protein [Phycisphaeraceae bacterium]MCW5762511.1 ABC transporter ATP-binding protein [Phycisphaeraceae bacterium]
MTTDGDLAINLSHVAKTYKGGVQALRGIEMKVHQGEVFGLLGPNGAGKSTLVKILMTVIRPTRCEGSLLGKPVGDKATLAQVGYLPEHHQFPDYLTARQLLHHAGAMTMVDRATRLRRADELIDIVGMHDWADERIGSFSKGMRQRVGIAQSLMNDPQVVLLDEPTDGVDPVGRRDIRAILLRLKYEGKTVFINSHLLSELEMVCDRVAILVAGTVRVQGTMGELTHARTGYVIRLEPGSDLEGAVAVARSGYAGEVLAGQGAINLKTSSPADVQPVIDALRRAGFVLAQLQLQRPTLEDLFMETVTDPTTGTALPPGADRTRKDKTASNVSGEPNS